MKRLRLIAILIVAAIIGSGIYLWVRAHPPPDLKTMYENHRWFQLRDAVLHPPTTLLGLRYEPPTVYQAAVAYAFHDAPAAEKLAFETLRSSRDYFEIVQALLILLKTYKLQGRYQEALTECQTILAKQPGNIQVKRIAALYEAATRLPKMSVVQKRYSKVPWTLDNTGPGSFPVSINGKPARCGIDTAADLSAISEAEASRLGLKLYDAPGHQVSDGHGNKVETRLALVENLSVGDFRLQNILFVVLPKPINPIVLGINVLLEFETIRWSKDQFVEVGLPAAPAKISDANLCFDDLNLIISAVFQNTPVYVALDTGSNETFFLPEFRRNFPAVAQASTGNTTQRAATFGGKIETQVTILPELDLHMGGVILTLKGAALRSKTDIDAWYHVWGGADLLKHSDVTLDLHAMRLTYE
jgi:predicted aspartyl protease